MTLTINGKQAIIEGRETMNITDLLMELNVTQKNNVTVELNGEILERQDFDKILVENGHKLEFFYLMGGGQ